MATKIEGWRYDTPATAAESFSVGSYASGFNRSALDPLRSGTNGKKYHTIYWYAPKVRGMVKVIRYINETAGVPSMTLTEDLLAYGNFSAGTPATKP